MVYLVVGWFGIDYKFWVNVGLFNNVLLVQIVVVFFLYCIGNQQGIFIFQIEVFNDFIGVNYRGYVIFLVGSIVIINQFISFYVFVWIEVLVFDVVNVDGIDMSVYCYQMWVVVDIIENVVYWVDFNFIEVDFFYFFFNMMYYVFFVVVFIGNSNYVVQEVSYICLVIFCFFKNQFEWNIFSYYFFLDFLFFVLQGVVLIG